MIKFILAGIWITVVTVGAVFYSFQSAQSKGGEESAPSFFGGLDYVKTPVISIPLMASGQVYGYFLTRLVYTVDPAIANHLVVPPEALFVDEIYSYLYGNPQLDFTDVAQVDLDAFREGIRGAINKRVEEELVHEVLIEQVDFLSKSEIRDNTIRRRESTFNAPGQAKAGSAASEHEASASGH